ncbi:MAG: methyltransferase [Spirochaetes bacterium]|nr:methyltransferase [Spirochaetota bacterium]
MNSLERFHATLDRKPVDRPCTWLGMPDPASLAGLFSYFGVENHRALLAKLGDDLFPVEIPWDSPGAKAIYCALDFSKNGAVDPAHRTLNAPGVFEDVDDLAAVERFPWPDPRAHIDPAACRRAVADVPEGKVALGVIWSAHFQDACAAFGMENALMTLVESPAMFQAVIDRVTRFYLEANAIFYEATRGKLHAVLIGNDFGSQTGLLCRPEVLRAHVLPGTKRLVDQAKGYGLRVIHHSCGSVRDAIPDLIHAGVDAIHPIQALAAGMDPAGLKRDFGDRVAFAGGVDAQELLVRGAPAQVRAKVRELRGLFPTGLLISPSHEAILPDIPPANIEALFVEAQAAY